MRQATQKESLPNDIEGLIRRLGQELSCSICLSVFEEPTMTPCNHTFCRECIERAVTLTKKSSAVPLNQCPICKSKAPKRSLNPAAAASKLCSIYEDIVRAYSEMNGGDEDWIHEAGIRGNDAYYTGGGVPLDNLSQLYPHPEKPGKVATKTLENISENENQNENESDLFTDFEDEIAVMRLNSTVPDDSELTQLETNIIESKVFSDHPSSPLIYPEETQLACDKLLINTQELEKLAAINDSIDKELAELERKLAEAKDLDKENVVVEAPPFVLNNKELSEKTPSISKEQVEATSKATKLKVNSSSSKKRAKIIIPEAVKVVKSEPAKIEHVFDPKAVLPSSKKLKKTSSSKASSESPEKEKSQVKGITTTGIKDEKDLIALTKFSDKFGFPVLPDLQDADVSHLLIPTTSTDLVVKKRTMKYFEALILGKEIVSFDWISGCVKAGKLISASEYRIKGDEIGLKHKQKKTGESRDYQKIFANYKFYFYGEFNQPPRDQLERLIRASGSAIIENVSDLSRGSIVLSDPSSQCTFERDAQIIKKYPIISPNWVLDSISCGRALEFHGYLVL